jgi:hypothetical protein
MDANAEHVCFQVILWEENHDSGLAFRLIFFAIPSATMRSESGMNGLLLQPGRDKGLRSPGSHRVTGWAAISFSSRAASSSRVSPIKTRLFAFCMRRGRMFFLTTLIKHLHIKGWMHGARRTATTG